MFSHYLIGYCIILNFIFINGQTNSTISLPMIKKCVCKANEVQTREGCIEMSHLNIMIFNSSINDYEFKDLNSLPFKIEPLRCPKDYVVDNLIGMVFISDDGKLMHHLENSTDEYCIENVRSDQGEFFQRAEKCMPPVYLCCEVYEYLDSSSRCTKIPSNSMITFAKDWVDKFQHGKKYVDCHDAENLHKTLSKDMPLSSLRNLLSKYDKITSGNFCLGMYGDENELYPGVSFCSSPDLDISDVIIPEIPECCGVNEAFDWLLGCVPYEENFVFPSNINWPSNGIKWKPTTMNCSYPSILKTDNETMHYFMQNGSLQSETGNIITSNKYCLGIIINENEVFHSGLMCMPQLQIHDHCLWRWKIYQVCLGISSFFLVLTLIVYAGIADLRRRISGVCLISELLALLVSQITLIVIQMRQSDLSAPGCLAAGIIEIIFVLASFFWLNIMCYDVWSTFRVFRPFSEKVFRLKSFLKYSLYAWGIPILVGMLALVLQLTDTQLKPGFVPGVKCFFNSKDIALQWFYLYGIILLLLLINLGFFVHLAFTLITNQMESRKHLRTKGGATNDKINSDIENLKLYGKLFVIMGLPWVIEIFTSFASPESECYIWFLDLFNMLRGFLIFIIFVCKKSTKDKLMADWFPSFKMDQDQSTSSRKISTTTLSLTNWLPSIHGRKISKVSLTSGGNVNLEALKEEESEEPNGVVDQREKEEAKS